MFNLANIFTSAEIGNDVKMKVHFKTKKISKSKLILNVID